MPTHLVNLDALIRREDFEETSSQKPASTRNPGFNVMDLAPDRVVFQVLRKPDFQRETANWTPETIAELVQSFLDEDLIPSIICWQSPDTGHIFVIDGAHRLSALIAWVHDDYGDGKLSRAFYENFIPREQGEAAKATRKLISDRVGTFSEVMLAAQHSANSLPLQVRRAGTLAGSGLPLQWVTGDAKTAEASFFKINQKATPIDTTELLMIKSRSKPNAIAARALLRAGSGHKYWSRFADDAQLAIENMAKEVYDAMFDPPMEEPVKTLDLPVAGRGYSAASVGLLFSFVNLANEVNPESRKQELQVSEDADGSQTLAFLKSVRRISRQISGTHQSCLGLHPVVYFYGITGRYQPTAFLATVRFLQELEKRDAFKKFTSARDQFEEFLLKYRYFKNQIVNKFGSATKSFETLSDMFWITYESCLSGLGEAETIEALKKHDKIRRAIKEMTEDDREFKRTFSRDTKSQLFISEAIDKALRCKICNARIHRKSISVDHITRMQDGGLGDITNAQLTHPYCNSGYKESLHSAAVKAANQ